jgi:hypothetical protein
MERNFRGRLIVRWDKKLIPPGSETVAPVAPKKLVTF